MDLENEFERQVNNLIIKRYSEMAGITEREFADLIHPLKRKINRIPARGVDLEKGRLPFVIVVKSTLVPTEKAMPLVEKNGRQGVIKLFPRTVYDFQILPEVEVPQTKIYLLVDIDRGRAFVNTTPKRAAELIQKQNRSPLTIDEGVAVVTQFPDFLLKNNCFSLLSSRVPGDKRVPAIWINAKKEPNLGWCWEGNPHSWLGSASCAYRMF